MVLAWVIISNNVEIIYLERIPSIAFHFYLFLMSEISRVIYFWSWPCTPFCSQGWLLLIHQVSAFMLLFQAIFFLLTSCASPSGHVAGLLSLGPLASGIAKGLALANWFQILPTWNISLKEFSLISPDNQHRFQ